MSTYHIRTFYKNAEVDDWEKGCIGPSSDAIVDVSFASANLSSLLDEVARFFGLKTEELVLDACEELGRIDVCRMENAEGDEPTPSEIEEWKAGKRQMWYATYSGYVQECRNISAIPIAPRLLPVPVPKPVAYPKDEYPHQHHD